MKAQFTAVPNIAGGFYVTRDDGRSKIYMRFADFSSCTAVYLICSNMASSSKERKKLVPIQKLSHEFRVRIRNIEIHDLDSDPLPNISSGCNRVPTGAS